MAERLLDLSTSFSNVLTQVQVFVRRLLELHVFKLVALYTVWVALKEVRAGHTPSLSVVGSLRASRQPPWISRPVGEGAAPPARLSHRCR